MCHLLGGSQLDPLRVADVQEGFARFALDLYTNDATQRSNSFVHLTNSSIQVENIASCQDPPPFLAACKEHKAGGSKMALSRLWPLLQAQGLNTTQAWEDICSVTLAALYSAQDAIPSQVCVCCSRTNGAHRAGDRACCILCRCRRTCLH